MPHIITASKYTDLLRARTPGAMQIGEQYDIGKYKVRLHKDPDDGSQLWVEVRAPGRVPFTMFPVANSKVWSPGKLVPEMRKHKSSGGARRTPPKPSSRYPWCLVLAGKVSASFEFLAWLAEYCPADLADIPAARKSILGFRLELKQTGWTSEAITEFAHEAKAWKPTLDLSYLDTTTGEVWEYNPED